MCTCWGVGVTQEEEEERNNTYSKEEHIRCWAGQKRKLKVFIHLPDSCVSEKGPYCSLSHVKWAEWAVVNIDKIHLRYTSGQLKVVISFLTPFQHFHVTCTQQLGKKMTSVTPQFLIIPLSSHRGKHPFFSGVALRHKLLVRRDREHLSCLIFLLSPPSTSFHSQSPAAMFHGKCSFFLVTIFFSHLRYSHSIFMKQFCL